MESEQKPATEELQHTYREEILKKNLLVRMRKIEGQIRGIENMIEQDRYCDDVLNQLNAATAALNGVSKLVLENHIRTCVVNKIRAKEDGIVEELVQTVNKLL